MNNNVTKQAAIGSTTEMTCKGFIQMHKDAHLLSGNITPLNVKNVFALSQMVSAAVR